MTDADIATWFRPVLSPADRAVLLDLVGRVDVALRGLGLEYIAYGGTLLGQCIYRDLLPWDDDADLLVLGLVPLDVLRHRLARALPDLCVVADKGQLKVVRPAPPGSARPWTLPFADIGFLYQQGGNWCHNSMWGGVDVFPLDDVTPTARGPLGVVEVSVPARPEAVCRRKYGADCLTSAVPPAFDHTTEKPTRFPKIRIPLEQVDRVLRGPLVVPRDPRTCVALVPSGKVVDREFEDALNELNRRGYAVRRLRQEGAPPGVRDRMAADALAEGFSELLWLDPAIVFDPADVEKLRTRDLPLVCGVYPASGWAALACEFPPDTDVVRFGTSGGPLPVLTCHLGFALIRRGVFEAIARQTAPGMTPAYFATTDPDVEPAQRGAEDLAFCRRARAAGFEVVADTSIRLWRVGRARLGWEDAAGERDRHPDFGLRVRAEPPADPGANSNPSEGPPRPAAARAVFRESARPLPAGFPRVRLYVRSYPANADSLARTLASVRGSDWGEEPVVLTQPDDWPVARASGARNLKRVLEAAAADGCDFALLLEDDVRVGRHLRHNVFANPLVAGDQCDHLGLFIPDLIADPWERTEPHLGYRLAKPRYAGPNAGWERARLWGSQGYLLSRRLVLAALDRWDRLTGGQDARVLAVCGELRVPLWYTVPCLVEHAPLGSVFGTPDARAPDFDPDFRLDVGAGFRPPEAVPGHLTRAEAELLWRTATGCAVLELGTGCGRSTVCLAQSAPQVVSVSAADQTEAAEWVRRFGVADRVAFRRGETADVCRELSGPFGLVVIDAHADAARLVRDITSVLPLVAPGGLLAFHGYPDPAWPDTRRVVDEHAARLGWTRTSQTGFLGVFRT